jgi:valyl-tRNA synthetase
MNKLSTSGPRLVVQITPEEKQIARQSKAEFKAVLKELKKAIDVISSLKNAITEQHPSKDDLKTKYAGRLLRYKKRITEAFNVFLTHLQKNLQMLGGINDPDMSRLREVLVSEVSEVTDGVEAILDLLHDVDKDDFTKRLEELTGQLEKRRESIDDAISNQLFNHIDQDLLGKMRISNLRFNLKKRARLLLLALREG